MENQKKYSNEIKLIFNYINDNLLTEYPTEQVTSDYFIIAIIETDENIANKVLSKYLMREQMQNVVEQCYAQMASVSKCMSKHVDENLIFKSNIINSISDTNIDSKMLLHQLFIVDDFTKKLFKQYGITTKHIEKEVETFGELPKKHEKKKKAVGNLNEKIKSSLKPKKIDNNEVDKHLIDINKLSQENKVDEYIGNDNIINSIIRICLKKQNNNIILTGENGVGKTSLVKHIANMINNGQVPKSFSNKKLMEINFSSLISGMMFKGAFESRVKNIIADAARNGNYIFFIDDINLLLEGAQYGNNDAEVLINNIINNDKICFIATCSTKGFSKLSTNYTKICKNLQRIELPEPDEALSIQILKKVKEKYELYHDVIYTDDALKTCIQICKRYYSDQCGLTTAIDILDEIGVDQSMKEKDSEEIKKLTNDINDILIQKKIISLNSDNKNYDEIDALTKKEIKLKSLLSLAIKSHDFNKKSKVINKKDICKFISSKIGIPLTQIEKNDKEKLKSLNENLKSIVIGQDEAIDAVCKVVKKQRLGLSNPNKPAVLLFTGSTGTGKTYLAKKLAEKVFGDEKYLVRFDMSEYSDKMASSKLIGSSAGYIGYENGGLLTEAIKNNKYCVLLLDECEKADESVFNMFLQIFDEGRLTDNKGVLVDFKNVIIIMTSNTGAQEVSERGGGVGFHKDEKSIVDFEKSIYEKAIKRKFKPEFINRIDKIVYFNRLTTNNLKDIIKIEIDKINAKLKTIGYSLNKNVYEPTIERIINNVSLNTEYGARYIIRELQTIIEDKITDLIIETNIKKGHIFEYDELN